MIRAVLVDDHLLLRQGTVALLRADTSINIVAETGSGAEVLNLVQRFRPDIVVLDIRLPDMSGVEVARLLRQEYPDIKILVLSAYQTEQYVRALFAIGVDGYLLKSASGTELINGVHAICRGETVLNAEIAAQMANKSQRSGIAATEHLSDREREVLVPVAQGRSNKEVATQLQIGVRTVETHVSNAMAKLRARSRTEVITTAIQRGIITLD